MSARLILKRSPSAKRWLKFCMVGLGGMAVQLSLIRLLAAAGLDYLLATALAVEAAVLHNFIWHQNFTWSDRPNPGFWLTLRRLAVFNLTTGAISIIGNVICMKVIAGCFAIPILIANMITIALCSLPNFLASDYVIFVVPALAPVPPAGSRRQLLKVMTTHEQQSPLRKRNIDERGSGRQSQPQPDLC